MQAVQHIWADAHRLPELHLFLPPTDLLHATYFLSPLLNQLTHHLLFWHLVVLQGHGQAGPDSRQPHASSKLTLPLSLLT